MRILLLLLLLTTCCSAELDRLLQFQLQGDDGAYISSGFHDWRTVSKYRSRPGLHAGYDIAMLAGSPVRAAWSGEVVAITPWYGTEYGVTVRDERGYEATYGHISPSISLGTPVKPGQILGFVVVDHLDVKMRNAQGLHVDFADLEFPSELAATANSLLRLKELEVRKNEVREQYSKMLTAFASGLASRRELEELRDELLALDPDAVPETVNAKEKIEPNRPVTDLLLQSTTPAEF